jgi:hypothetical protein
MRERVGEIIREFAGNPAKAAMEVGTYFEDKLELGGNGWWNNDSRMKAHLRTEIAPCTCHIEVR